MTPPWHPTGRSSAGAATEQIPTADLHRLARRDLVCHLIIDAQDVLITLATPTGSEPTRNAVTYWDLAQTPPSGDDPLDSLIVRLAAAYQEPRLLQFHLDLIAHLPDAAQPPIEGLAQSRHMSEKIAGTTFPTSFCDRDALLVGTGRRAPTDAEKAELGELTATLPLVLR